MKHTEFIYLSAFIEIARSISSSIQLNEVLYLIVKSTCEATGLKGCALMLLDEREEELVIKSSYGLSDQYIGKGPLSTDKSISDTLKGEPIIIEDVRFDPRVQYPQEAREEGIASIVSVPILIRNKIMGALRLYTSVPCRFSEDDIQFLSAVATQSGLAIENAKMFEHVKGNSEKGSVSFSSLPPESAPSPSQTV